MFTGIIESTGIIKEIITVSGIKSFWIESPISHEFTADQSVNHNGACLTIEEVRENRHRVTAIEETLKKTNLDLWKTGDLVNLERCLKLDSRLDGHIVQGHVDTTGTCIKRKEKTGSLEFTVRFSKKFAGLIVEKGSVCMNGISLTVFNISKKTFTVAIIPYTLSHTSLQSVKEDDVVNLEFDLVGKYILRSLSLK